MADELDKVRVLIATTTGPVEVLRLVEENPAIGRSVVCIDGTTEIAGITPDYQAFVASPTGIIQRLYGHSCYRLDISEPIDNGSSFQLGAFAAHALQAVDRLAQEEDDYGTIVLVTGSVRAVDLEVREVTHVSRKIERALELLRQERQRGRRVIVAVPAGNLPEVPHHQRLQLEASAIRLLPVANLGQLTGELNLRTPNQALQSLDVGSSTASRRSNFSRQLVFAISATVAVGGAVTAAQFLTMRPSADPAIAESKIFDGFWEVNGQGSAACPVKVWTSHIRIDGGRILSSRPEKGFVRPTGEFRYTHPSRPDPSLTVEFTGHLLGGAGRGEYRAIGGRCAGTFTIVRIEQ